MEISLLLLGAFVLKSLSLRLPASLFCADRISTGSEASNDRRSLHVAAQGVDFTSLSLKLE
jgi:hypothetical protein